jgi:hypothetical protein
MRARTFKNQFEPAITRKVNPKRQTIRPTPKRMPKAGDLESWRVWTGRPYNSPQRELVQVRLTSVEVIEIIQQGINLLAAPEWGRFQDVSTRKGRYFLEQFSRADGFDGWESMRDFFINQHGLPFTGILIEAEDI